MRIYPTHGDAVTTLFAMAPIFKETYFLSAGECNAEHELSLPVLTTKLIDIATAHANSLGIGNPSMESMNGGWVLSRLTIDMDSYPTINENYCISTWVVSFNRHFSERAFCISSENGDVFGYVRSIWMVIDIEKHTNLGLSHLSLPAEIIVGNEPPIPKQTKHLDIVSPEDGELPKGAVPASHEPFDYRFKYCDLDFYRHVNTVRYITLLLNRFSLEEHDKCFVKRLELSFLHEARYGMETRLMRSDSFVNEKENSDHVSSFLLKDKADNSPLLFARLFRAERKH